MQLLLKSDTAELQKQKQVLLTFTCVIQDNMEFLKFTKTPKKAAQGVVFDVTRYHMKQDFHSKDRFAGLKVTSQSSGFGGHVTLSLEIISLFRVGQDLNEWIVIFVFLENSTFWRLWQKMFHPSLKETVCRHVDSSRQRNFRVLEKRRHFLRIQAAALPLLLRWAYRPAQVCNPFKALSRQHENM